MALPSASLAQAIDMICRQRAIHRFVWLLLVPALGTLIWLGATHRDATVPSQLVPSQLAPYVMKEAQLP
jgi:hypothetical protein